jgi:hypothetical protein
MRNASWEKEGDINEYSGGGGGYINEMGVGGIYVRLAGQCKHLTLTDYSYPLVKEH